MSFAAKPSWRTSLQSQTACNFWVSSLQLLNRIKHLLDCVSDDLKPQHCRRHWPRLHPFTLAVNQEGFDILAYFKIGKHYPISWASGTANTWGALSPTIKARNDILQMPNCRSVHFCPTIVFFLLYLVVVYLSSLNCKEGSGLRYQFPLLQQLNRIAGWIIIYELRTVLAKPESILNGLPLFVCETAVIPWPARRCPRNVGRYSNIDDFFAG
jgi:hypothetical protein